MGHDRLRVEDVWEVAFGVETGAADGRKPLTPCGRWHACIRHTVKAELCAKLIGQ